MNNRSEVPLVRFDAKLAEELRADPAIAAVDPILQIPARISKAGAPAEAAGRGRRRDGAGGSQATSPSGDAKGGENGTAGTPARGAGRGRRGQVSPPLLVGTNAAEPPYELEEGRWIDPRRADANEAVISSGYAQQLKVKLGDEVEIRGANGAAEKVTIVGIAQQRKALPPPPPLPGTHPPRGCRCPGGRPSKHYTSRWRLRKRSAKSPANTICWGSC